VIAAGTHAQVQRGFPARIDTYRDEGPPPAQPGSAWAGLLAHTPLRQIDTITPCLVGSASTVVPAPAPGIDAAEFGVTLVQLSSKTILIAVGADAAWLPARDTGRASRSGRLRLGDDLRATLGADTRDDAHADRPGRHQQADGHH
jgi:hypothetical protein